MRRGPRRIHRLRRSSNRRRRRRRYHDSGRFRPEKRSEEVDFVVRRELVTGAHDVQRASEHLGDGGDAVSLRDQVSQEVSESGGGWGKRSGEGRGGLIRRKGSATSWLDTWTELGRCRWPRRNTSPPFCRSRSRWSG